MRNLGLTAFVLTTCVLVPAAVHHLRAGHDQVLKFGAPDAQELELGGATIHAKLDHAIVDPGEAIHLTLAASGATGKRLDVGVLVYGSSGSEGDRVPSPPVAVAHETVRLPIDASGNGTKEIAVALRGAAFNQYMDTAFSHYTVLVMAPKAADRLALLHRRAQLIGGDEGIPYYNKSGERFMQLYAWGGDLEGEDAKLFAEGAVARLAAHTRSINRAIAIETPATTAVGQVFTVAVVVKNPGKKAATGLELSLDTPAGVLDESEGISALVMPDTATFDLAAGESRRFEFRVMPDEVGVLGLHARVTCNGDECEAVDALTSSGTFDATEIVPAKAADPAPAIIGAK
ncbi:MAG TPA: hypothetical protein VNO30_20145 [Kofleriaceae bacterium]|nr:hypothetical protein [Kofleriaceae bacterium]